jgi:aspartyl protease family protein
MARAIRFRAQGSQRIRVGSGEVIEMPRGRISSICVGEAESNNLTVLVGSTPLLGQNFFSDYNVTISQDFIVFRRRVRELNLSG